MSQQKLKVYGTLFKQFFSVNSLKRFEQGVFISIILRKVECTEIAVKEAHCNILLMYSSITT